MKNNRIKCYGQLKFRLIIENVGDFSSTKSVHVVLSKGEMNALHVVGITYVEFEQISHRFCSRTHSNRQFVFILSLRVEGS